MNQRKRRDQYLLDVKIHTEGRTRQRVRWLAAVATALVVLSLTSYGLYRGGKVGLAKLVFENPRFAISKIKIEDDGVLTPGQVMFLGNVHLGQNILSLDLNEVQRNLESIPMIRRVEVRRTLPHRIDIHVDERVAVARLRGPSKETADELFWIDRSGMVMKPVHLGSMVIQPQTVGPVPLLTGVTVADVRVGKPVESDQIHRALLLLDRLAQAPAGGFLEVEQIDLSKPCQLSLTTRQKTVVKFDVEDFQQQLRRMSTILVWAQRQQKQVQVMDLTVSRGVPVTFMN